MTWLPRCKPAIVLCALPLLVCAFPERSAGPSGDVVQAAERAEDGEELLRGVHQLTFAGRRAGEGYFGPDGTKLIFQSEREPGNPFYQIYWLDLETGELRRVSPGYGKATCAWIHPGNGRVLFASTHHDPDALAQQRAELEQRASGRQRPYAWDFDEQFDLYAAAPDGSALVRLTDARGYDAEGSWSPDGSLVLFASNRHAYREELSEEERARFEADPSYLMDLYRMDADGSNVRRLTRAPGYDGGPFFSADGRRIAWRRFSPDGATAEIFTMELDEGAERQITRLGALSWAPFFHPSGNYLVFSTNVHGFGNFELYLVDADGRSDPVRVTYSDGFDGLPAFSPDGRTLVWSSGRTTGERPQIFLADWDDAAARRLLDVPERAALGREAELEPSEPVAVPAPEIRVDDLRRHVARLASEAVAGRLTGSAGERLAANYVAEAFRAFGLEPAGDGGSYLQPFAFTAGVSLDAGNQLELRDERGELVREFAVEREWLPLGLSRTGKIEAAGVVFAGYGIVAPGSGDLEPYDAYGDLDVEGRWVLVLRDVPGGTSATARQHWRRHAMLRYKAALARDRGARGLLVASGPNARVRDPLIRLRNDGPAAATAIAGLSLADEVADAILAPAGRNLQQLQDRLDRGERVPGFEIPGVALAAQIALRQEKRVGYNVLARLPGGENRAPPLVVGAHLDHLGRGLGGNSLAAEGDQGQIHYGADDNASGVAALLEIARHLAAERRRGGPALERDVLFAAWSGEELGLIGSTHFANALVEEPNGAADLGERVAAYLNMDMVGRLDRHLVLQGVGSSSVWRREIERLNVPIGLPIVAQEDPYLPTDATAFYLRGVPVLSAFTGAHADYHTPRDTPEKLNYRGTARIAQFMLLLARALAERSEAPDYVAVKRPRGAGGRADLRVYLGTIPDYAGADATGLRLAGVATGGPAARAGLRAGDVVVELGGRTVGDIYDYTYAIEALEVGEPVEIVVEREGDRLRRTVIPESRE